MYGQGGGGGGWSILAGIYYNTQFDFGPDSYAHRRAKMCTSIRHKIERLGLFCKTNINLTCLHTQQERKERITVQWLPF